MHDGVMGHLMHSGCFDGLVGYLIQGGRQI